MISKCLQFSTGEYILAARLDRLSLAVILLAASLLLTGVAFLAGAFCASLVLAVLA